MIITIGKPCAITEKGGRSNNEDSIYPLPEQVTLDQNCLWFAMVWVEPRKGR